MKANLNMRNIFASFIVLSGIVASLDVQAEKNEPDRQTFFKDYYNNRDDPDKDVKNWESWNENMRDRSEEDSWEERIIDNEE